MSDWLKVRTRRFVVRLRRVTRRQWTGVALVLAYLGLLYWAHETGHKFLVVMSTLLLAGLVWLVKRTRRATRQRRAKLAAVNRDRMFHQTTRWPKVMANILKPVHEEIVEHEERMHPFFIFYSKSAAWCAFVAGLLILASFIWQPEFLFGTLMALILMLILSVPRMFTWWFTRRCYTSIRVIEVSGVINRKYRYVPLFRIESASFDIPWISPILERLGMHGVWDWSIDTQVQKDPINALPWTRHPSKAGEILQRYVLVKPAATTP